MECSSLLPIGKGSAIAKLPAVGRVIKFMNAYRENTIQELYLFLLHMRIKKNRYRPVLLCGEEMR